MDADDLMLGLFAALPPAFGVLSHLFFRRHRLHRRAATGAARLGLLLLGNGLVAGLLLSLLLLGGECYYRFFYDTTDAFALTKTSRRWLSRHVQMNNANVRDNVLYSVPIPRGKRRVTFLGDSFTAGHGVADVEARFANRLRRMRPGWDINVFATNGWETEDELAFLSTTLPRRTRGHYQMDELVLVYCLNDIADLIPVWDELRQRLNARPEPPFLFRHSYLLNTLYYRVYTATDPDLRSYYPFTLRAYDGDVWQEQQKRLKEFIEHARLAHAHLSVVTFPFMHLLGPQYPYRVAHERLRGFWRDNGVPHLDLLDVYAGSRPADITVNHHDPHPNERAHEMAAAALAPFLDRQLTEPRPVPPAAPQPPAPAAARPTSAPAAK